MSSRSSRTRERTRDTKRQAINTTMAGFFGQKKPITELGKLVAELYPALIISGVGHDVYLSAFVTSVYEPTFESAVIIYIRTHVVPAAQSFLDYYYTMTEQQWKQIWGNPRNMHWNELWKRVKRLRIVWHSKKNYDKLTYPPEPRFVSKPKHGWRHP